MARRKNEQVEQVEGAETTDTTEEVDLTQPVVEDQPDTSFEERTAATQPWLEYQQEVEKAKDTKEEE